MLDPRPQYFQKYEEACRYLPLLDNNPNAANYNQKGKQIFNTYKLRLHEELAKLA